MNVESISGFRRAVGRDSLPWKKRVGAGGAVCYKNRPKAGALTEGVRSCGTLCLSGSAIPHKLVRIVQTMAQHPSAHGRGGGYLP